MSTPHFLAPPVRRWECPNCSAEHVTEQAEPHTPFHTCPGLRGLTAPYIPAGTKAQVVAVEREDYVGGEDVQRDAEGRPVMSVVTVRDDGQDVAVYAPTANVKFKEH